MLDLSPLSYYEYQVGNGHLWSKVYPFRGIAPCRSTENAQTYQMLVLRDIGNYDQSKTNLTIHPHSGSGGVLAFAHLGDADYNMQDREGRDGDFFLRAKVAERVISF